jgi:DNA-binding winged helix-turn-helix (wHTH) protein
MAASDPGRLTTGTNSTPADGRRIRTAQEKDVAMRAYKTNRDSLDRTKSASVATDTRISDPRPVRLLNASSRLGQHRCFARGTHAPPMPRNEAAELLSSIEGLPNPVRHLVQDVLAELRTDVFSEDADIRSLLPSTLERIADRMRGSSFRREAGSERHLGSVEVPSSENPPPVAGAETTLRVGALELDLIDRTARRGERRIDLRPREFLLLKYMMQRSDEVLTRATLLKEVWNYKFVPETNLVDVHLGRLRRKVDAADEAPMIRNIRGLGFVLSANPLSLASPPRCADRPTTLRSETNPRLVSNGTAMSADNAGSISPG